jgi:hypothetical protein
LKFKYPIYNPCSNVLDVAADWGSELFTTTHDIDLALAQPFSIAAVRVFYNRPDVYSYDPSIKDIDLSKFDLVLISDAEYSRLNDIEEWISTLGIKQYLLALGGSNPSDILDPTRMVFRNYYVKQYIRNNEFVDTWEDQKPFQFDCMLGARRPHRDYVMLALTRSKLLEQSVVTYRDCFPGVVINSLNNDVAKLFPNTKLNWPYVSPNLNPSWEVAEIVNNQISFMSPYEIYKQTYYSILTETLGVGESFFLSEKTIKAMFCKRIFIVFGNQYYLERLRKLGFQTFIDIVDEDYDNEPRDIFRYQKAMHQVLKLAYLGHPATVKKEVEHVLEHNFKVLHSLPTRQQYEMQDLLVKHISHEHFYY